MPQPLRDVRIQAILDSLRSTPEATRELRIQSVARPVDFCTPFGEHEYAMLVVSGGNVPQLEIAEFCRRVVTTPCRYAVSWGQNCGAWHNCFDIEFVNAHPDCEPLLMTTDHPDESLADAVWHFKNLTGFDDFKSDRMIVLLVRTDPTLENEVRAAVMEQFGIDAVRD